MRSTQAKDSLEDGFLQLHFFHDYVFRRLFSDTRLKPPRYLTLVIPFCTEEEAELQQWSDDQISYLTSVSNELDIILQKPISDRPNRHLLLNAICVATMHSIAIFLGSLEAKSGCGKGVIVREYLHCSLGGPKSDRRKAFADEMRKTGREIRSSIERLWIAVWTHKPVDFLKVIA